MTNLPGPAAARGALAIAAAIALTLCIGVARGRAADRLGPDYPAASALASPSLFSAAALIAPQVGVDDVGPAWNAGLTGAGIGVAVIDSGVAPLPELGSRLVPVDLGYGTTDAIGHGTLVAGALAGASTDGRFVGVAPGATVYGIDVASTDGVRTSDVIRAVDWIQEHADAYGIRVVNVSLSETTSSSYLASALDAALERLWRTGIVVVVSSGNGGSGSLLAAPANDPFLITVGALDTADTPATDDDRQASWSSTGPTLDGVSKPDLLAPGRHVVSTLPHGTALAAVAPAANTIAPGYVRANGSSFAAPQVAGAAALLLQLHPTWTPNQVKGALLASARRVPGAAPALDVGAALRVRRASANRGLRPSFGRGSPDALLTTGGLVGWNAAATWNASATWNTCVTWNASTTWN